MMVGGVVGKKYNVLITMLQFVNLILISIIIKKISQKRIKIKIIKRIKKSIKTSVQNKTHISQNTYRYKMVNIFIYPTDEKFNDIINIDKSVDIFIKNNSFFFIYKGTKNKSSPPQKNLVIYVKVKIVFMV